LNHQKCIPMATVLCVPLRMTLYYSRSMSVIYLYVAKQQFFSFLLLTYTQELLPQGR